MPSASVSTYPVRGISTWEDRYLARAAQFLGTTDLWHYSHDFLTLTGWSDGSSGGTADGRSDTEETTNSTGGIVLLSSGTTASGFGRLHATGDFGSTLDYNSSSVKFYRAARVKFATTADANMQCWVGAHVARMGILGQSSSTNYSFQLSTSGGDVYVTSSVAVSTDWIIMETWWDSALAQIAINEGSADSASVTFPLNANGAFPDMRAGKVGGATNYQMYVDWVLYAGTTGA